MDIKKCVEELIEELKTGPYQDLSDVGNIVGIVIGKYATYDDIDDGSGVADFEFGLKHGFDLSKARKIVRQGESPK